MSQLPVAYVDVRFCAHATEDLNKVMDAVQNILPSEYLEDITFNKSILEGHYGNPITFFETRIKDKKTIKALIEQLAANLSILDKEELKRIMCHCIEKGSLYIRLDKQAAFKGKTKLVTSDPIRIRIRFRKSKTEDVIVVCKEIGMIT
ncbi:MAG: RNA-binding domain-containing protein [Candidatus Bathyarchaeia archaeon]|nr:RNA-binding domain-containing protein [Candidatus Bathyarchaeia archaeon]